MELSLIATVRFEALIKHKQNINGSPINLHLWLTNQSPDMMIPTLLKQPMVFLNNLSTNLPIPQFPSCTLQMLQTHLINAVAFFLQIPSQAQTKINILQPIIIIPRKPTKPVKLDLPTQQKRPSHSSREEITPNLRRSQIIAQTLVPNLFRLEITPLFIPNKLNTRMLYPRFLSFW